MLNWLLSAILVVLIAIWQKWTFEELFHYVIELPLAFVFDLLRNTLKGIWWLVVFLCVRLPYDMAREFVLKVRRGFQRNAFYGDRIFSWFFAFVVVVFVLIGIADHYHL